MRVLLVEDDKRLGAALADVLRSHGITVDLVGNAEDAVGSLRQDHDAVVLDLGLPDRDGHEVLSELRQWSQVPVLMLSVRSAEAEKVRALDAGANDYVTKPFGIQELMARLRALLRDRAVAGAEEVQPRYDDGRLGIDLARREVMLDGAPLSLTRKEYTVLALLLRHAGRVVTQQQLLREVWGASHVQDSQYLRIVIGKLRQKLGDDPAQPRWLKTEPGVGYRFVGRND